MRLPVRARVAALALLVAASAPPVALLGASMSTAWSERLSAHAAVVDLIASGVVIAILVAFERPRAASAIGYARQLRARLHELETDLDAGLRRRPGEGKEKEDAVQHPSNQ